MEFKLKTPSHYGISVSFSLLLDIWSTKLMVLRTFVEAFQCLFLAQMWYESNFRRFCGFMRVFRVSQTWDLFRFCILDPVHTVRCCTLIISADIKKLKLISQRLLCIVITTAWSNYYWAFSDFKLLIQLVHMLALPRKQSLTLEKHLNLFSNHKN